MFSDSLPRNLSAESSKIYNPFEYENTNDDMLRLVSSVMTFRIQQK